MLFLSVLSGPLILGGSSLRGFIMSDGMIWLLVLLAITIGLTFFTFVRRYYSTPHNLEERVLFLERGAEARAKTWLGNRFVTVVLTDRELLLNNVFAISRMKLPGLDPPLMLRVFKRGDIESLRLGEPEEIDHMNITIRLKNDHVLYLRLKSASTFYNLVKRHLALSDSSAE